MFEKQVRIRPDAVAVSCESCSLAYRELNERANQLAWRLRQCGVGPETRVALYLDRSLETAVAILGVLKAGGAYVPIDPAYPADRIAFMLSDSAAPVVLTQERLCAAISSAGRMVLCLDSDSGRLSERSVANPPVEIHGDNAAYIIYTSGSTGKPKGVVVTHDNVVRLLTQTEPWYGFGASDVWPWFHSYAFDVSVWEMWGALFYGGRLVVVPHLVSRSPAEFLELLAHEKATVLNQTPSAFRQLIHAAVSASERARLRLRYVICAGEALELQSLRPWFDLYGDRRPQVVNMYGITETTVHAMYRPIRRADLENGCGSVIGVPIPDLQIRLLDANLEPVPPGVPGEICVGGAGLARGYLNRPELTRERFVPDPFAPVPGARLYRSGDLAQIGRNGEMEYLGRIDDQVKIRGFRVELGEIESALNRHPAVRESAVVAHDGHNGDKRLVAYVAVKGTAPTVSELREHLAASLPEYMVPGQFVFLDAFPLNTNGKLDRRMLPAPNRARPALRSTWVAPRNEKERALARIWSVVLEVEGIGVHDNFFELGGDSIRSLSVLSKAQEAGMRFSLQQLFGNPTIARLAELCEASSPAGAVRRTKPFELISEADRARLPEDVENACPIAKLQLGMFYHNELDPYSAMYHDVFSYRVEARFDAERLALAIEAVTQRHPILRTSFHLAGYSEPLQLVHQRCAVPLSIEDLRGVSAESRDEQVVEWIEQEKRRSFDRSTAPLVRLHVQRHGEAVWQLFVSFHHACLDGWSLAALVTELLTEYAGLLEGKPANVKPAATTYADFVALEQEAIRSGATRRFWLEKIEEAPVQLLPRWPEAYRSGGHEQVRGPEIRVGAEVLEGLRELARVAGVPLKTVLLAAHQRVMALLYGQDDVLSGLVCNGRPEAEDGERMLGVFLNTVPFRLRLKNGASWLSLVKDTFAAEQELLPHRRFPLAEVKKARGLQPLFETAFDFVQFHRFNDLQGCPGVRLQESHYFEANNLTAYTTFMLDATGARLELHVDYDPALMTRRQVEQLSAYYLATLRAMAKDPLGRQDAFSPLSDEERREEEAWNVTEEPYPSACIHELFEQRTEETPEAIAVAWENERWTYRELDRRADGVAAELERLGAGPDVLVGLYADRSPGMIAGLLGILKAGAAYVPLDPVFPQERIARMVSDAALPIIVTERRLATALPPSSAVLVRLDEVEGKRRGGPRPGRAARPENLVYVIYTSGSTGRPKGVQVPHRAVVNALTSIGKRARIGRGDNLLAVTTISFDIAALEIFLPLMTGGTVTLAGRDVAADGTQLARLIESSGVTVMQGTPATWRLLIESGWQGRKSLKVLCGGEALTRKLADDLLARAGEVWNLYGPTETTIWSAMWRGEANVPISIGMPLANTHVHILDRNLRLLPVGVVGELHIGGEGLARGYLNRPELTEQKFIPDPFRGRGNRLYRTGDLARRLPDGTIECLGRMDHQVKVRGFRVEPGEIESVLREHPSVREALVRACENGFGEKRLVGYLLPSNGAIPVAEVREFLKSRLPFYMVPAHLIRLDAFPLTPNGKVDYSRLPPADGSQWGPVDCVPPRDADEQVLAEIWMEVLGLKRVSIHENFFDLGGDSLSATRAFARINQRFGTTLALRDVFEHPTIAAQAEVLHRLKGIAPSQDRIVARPHPVFAGELPV